MNKRVLVAYATRTGSTVEVAGTIGETLGMNGTAVDVKPIEEELQVNSYQAVLIGSAVQHGNWLPEAVDFVKLTRVPSTVCRWRFSASTSRTREMTKPVGGTALLTLMRFALCCSRLLKVSSPANSTGALPPCSCQDSCLASCLHWISAAGKRCAPGLKPYIRY